MRTLPTLFSGALALAAFAHPASAGIVVFPSSSAGGTGHGYELVLNPAATFSSASAAAASAGGYLATLTSAAEQNFVRDLLQSESAPTGSYFFGLQRVGETDNFAWATTGETFSYNNFAPGEPNDYKSGENVGQIYWTADGETDTNARRGKWNDAAPSGYRNSTIRDLNTAGFLIEHPSAGTGGGNNGGGGGDDNGNGGNNGGNTGGGGNNGGSNGGGPAAVPLPPAVFAAPVAFAVAQLARAARRRRR